MVDRQVAERFPVIEFIKDEISARGWTFEDLALRMGGDFGINLLSLQMMEAVEGMEDQDKRNVVLGMETAQQLAHAFGTSVQLWVNLDKCTRGEP